MFILGTSVVYFFFFKQKTAYDMRISDWSSDVCSSDLRRAFYRIRGTVDRAGTGCNKCDPIMSCRCHRSASKGPHHCHEGSPDARRIDCRTPAGARHAGPRPARSRFDGWVDGGGHARPRRRSEAANGERGGEGKRWVEG